MYAKSQTSQPSKTNTKQAHSAARNVPSSSPNPGPAELVQLAAYDPTRLSHQNVMALQRTIGNQAVGRLLEAHKTSGAAVMQRAVDGSNDPIIPVQRKTLSGLSSGASVVGNNKVYLSDAVLTVGSYWEVPVGTKNSRAELIAAIAKTAGETGNEINGKINGQGWNYSTEDRTKYDPIRVRFSGKYGLGEPKSKLELDFHYGSSFSGYVIHVTDAGAGINQEMHNPESPDELDDGTEYSHIHSIEEHPAGPLEQAGGADNITKLAGEGARWKSIGENAGILQDNSKIYTNQNAAKKLTKQVRYVTFPTLWKSWKETFDKGYGISDTTVAKKLEETNLQITTGDGVVNSPVATADCNTMQYGLDIAVDPEKPAQQADLNSKSVSYLHFKKSGTVIELKKTYAQEEKDAKDAVGKIAGVRTLGHGGYIGQQKFAYLCEVGPLANPKSIVGYTSLEDDTALLSYPAYRAPAMLPLAKNTATGPNIGKGQALYDKEKRDRYQEMVDDFVEEINSCKHNIDGLDEIDVEDFVRKELIPWDDPGAQLPQLTYNMDRYDGDLADYYRPKIEAYSKRIAEEREAKIEEEVEKRVASIPYFVSKKKTEQSRIRSEIREEVLKEFE